MNRVSAVEAQWQKLQVTELEVLHAQYSRLRLQYANDPSPSFDQRLQRLSALKAALLKEKKALVEALSEDFGFRPHFDSTFCDVLPVINQIKYTQKNLKKWMKPSRRHAGLLVLPSKVQVHYQPLGVVGIVVPWNFPAMLSLSPLVTAIAAGNQAMIKFSEYTPATNKVLTRIISSLGDIAVCVEGDLTIATAFSSLPFDHLLFTGSTPVGKIVAQSAAKNLTPVTLELGGKSPTIIAPDADLVRSIDNIMQGKAINSGQICIAPDYVMLPADKVEQFVELYLKRFAKRYINKHGVLDCAGIINQAQLERLQSYLEDAKQKGAQIYTVKQSVELKATQMAPSLVTNVTDDMWLMQNEIFGPILPVIGYKTIEEAIERVNSHARPLALYLMTDDNDIAEYVLKHTHSGGVCINDTLMHVAADSAPFGGIGDSGMGHYHGIEGFKTFTHAKTVVRSWSKLPRSSWILSHRKSILYLLNRFLIR